MAEPTDKRLFSEGQIRLAFIASGVGMVSVLVLLMILATARPQGAYESWDGAQYEATLQDAAARLTTDAAVPIDEAMRTIAASGFVGPIGELPDAAAPATTEGADAAEEVPAAEPADPSGGQEPAGLQPPDEAPDAPVDDAVPEGDVEADPEVAAETDNDAEADAEADPEAGTDPATEDAAGGGEPAAQVAELPDGSQVYANCSGCHQANGQGVPTAFPPLAQHAVQLFQADRTYLPLVILYGLQGQIQVDGQTYNGVMPAWPQLSDEQIASVLNHTLTQWGNQDLLPQDAQLYTPQDVAEQRGRDLSPADVHDIRQDLQLP